MEKVWEGLILWFSTLFLAFFGGAIVASYGSDRRSKHSQSERAASSASAAMYPNAGQYGPAIKRRKTSTARSG